MKLNERAKVYAMLAKLDVYLKYHWQIPSIQRRNIATKNGKLIPLFKRKL
jgi:hypothetical protein